MRMRAGLKLLLWVAASTALCSLTAPQFPDLVSQSTGNDFGALFVAVPVVALLSLIFALRWGEFSRLLDRGGQGSSIPFRLAGASAIAGLVAVEPLTGETLAAAAVAVVLTFYSSSLLIVPSARRFILPYTAVFGATVAAPAVLLWAFGEPLAVLSSGLSAKAASLAGLPVLWQGTQFEIIAKTGAVSGLVSPSCSSVTSVTTFLGLLALMHLDMKKDLRSTAKMAVAGVFALSLLDSVRIFILLWVGYEYGADALWGVHDWIGYAMFLGFFLTALLIYTRMGATFKAKAELGTGPVRPFSP